MSGLAVVEYTAEETAYLRDLYRAWKRENGVGSDRPLHDVPALRVAFRRILVDNDYAYSDLGRWLGISRERVRQVANAMGIDAPRASKRVWCDELNRFVGVSGPEYRQAERDRSRYGEHVVPYRDRVAKRRRVASWIVRDMAEDLGRIPCQSDLAEAWRMSPACLNTMALGARGGTATTLDRVWAEAGQPYRPVYSGFDYARPKAGGDQPLHFRPVPSDSEGGRHPERTP